MQVEVQQFERGDFVATVFTLPDGRVIVTDNATEGAILFRSRDSWEQAKGPWDALEEYESVIAAFMDVLPEPTPIP